MKYVSKFLDAIRPQASESEFLDAMRPQASEYELCLKELLNEGFASRQNHHPKLTQFSKSLLFGLILFTHFS